MFSLRSCGTNLRTSSLCEKSVCAVTLPDRKPLAMGENGTTPMPRSRQIQRHNAHFLLRMLFRQFLQFVLTAGDDPILVELRIAFHYLLEKHLPQSGRCTCNDGYLHISDLLKHRILLRMPFDVQKYGKIPQPKPSPKLRIISLSFALRYCLFALFPYQPPEPEEADGVNHHYQALCPLRKPRLGGSHDAGHQHHVVEQRPEEQP